MLELVLSLIGIYVLALVTWLFYLAAVNLIKLRKQLTGFAKFNGYILVAIGLTLDITVNAVIGTLLFLEPPREVLFTQRLQRHKLGNVNSYKYKLAYWLCANLLNPFDPDHC